MIFLPWIVFSLGIVYIVWQGLAERRKYLQRQTEDLAKAQVAAEQEKARRTAREDELVDRVLSRIGH
jgi:hypothetical protein